MFKIQNATFLFHPMNVHEDSNFMNQTTSSVLSHMCSTNHMQGKTTDSQELYSNQM